MFRRFGGKASVTESMNQSVIDEGVYRTALATPGLLIIRNGTICLKTYPRLRTPHSLPCRALLSLAALLLPGPPTTHKTGGMDTWGRWWWWWDGGG